MKRVLAGLVLALAVKGAEERTTEHKTFSGVRELVIDNITGFIEVTASTGGAVEMDIEKTFSGDSADRLALAKKEISLNETQEGGLLRLIVDGPFRRYNSWHDVYHFQYDFKVRVPREVKLELRTVNHSHITVQGTSGDYLISNVNGPIEMTEVSGSGTVHTVNGKVKVVYAANPQGATSFKTVIGYFVPSGAERGREDEDDERRVIYGFRCVGDAGVWRGSGESEWEVCVAQPENDGCAYRPRGAGAAVRNAEWRCDG